MVLELLKNELFILRQPSSLQQLTFSLHDVYQIDSVKFPDFFRFSPNISIKFSGHCKKENAEDGVAATVQAVPV